MESHDLISDEYLRQLHLLREDKPGWGGSGKMFSKDVQRYIDQFNCKSVLDYGAGRGTLLRDVNCPVKVNYDPGVPRFSKIPDLPFDMVACTDVLEHIEPEKLDNVIQHIHSLTRTVAYIHIHLGKAVARLPDGRNAHLIQEPETWWRIRLGQYFGSVGTLEPPHFNSMTVLCRP